MSKELAVYAVGKVEGPHRAVDVPAAYLLAARAGRERDAVGAVRMRVERRRLVGLELPDLHLALGRGEDHLVVPSLRPGERGDGLGLQKLVADGLLVPPLQTELVHEHYVVALRDGKLGGVGRERHPPHHEVFNTVGLRGLGGELVLALAVLVKELDHPVGGHCRHAPRVR